MIELLADPNAALLALLGGILLVYCECNRPGSIVPGCLGTVLVLLSLNSLHQLPLRASALAMLATGLALTLAATALRLRHLSAAAGVVFLTLGMARLVQPFGAAHVHIATAVVAAAGFAFPTLWLGRVALLARRNKRTLRPCAAPQRRTG